MKESELQRKMIDILRKKGCYVINNHGSLYSANGVADLTVSFGGDGEVFVVHGDTATNEALLANAKALTKQLKQSGLVRIK